MTGRPCPLLTPTHFAPGLQSIRHEVTRVDMKPSAAPVIVETPDQPSSTSVPTSSSMEEMLSPLSHLHSRFSGAPSGLGRTSYTF